MQHTDLKHTQFFFSIKTAEEINERMNGLKLEEPVYFSNVTFKEASGLSIPQSVDWRKSGLVSPVQNQVSNDQLFSNEDIRKDITGGNKHDVSF